MINLNTVKPGERAVLKDGRTGVVVENMGDGQWLEVRFPDAPDDEPELVHSQDLQAIRAAE
jgi:hypothetical protein